MINIREKLENGSQTPLLFIIIGCGGVGGNLIRDLPKLLIGLEKRAIMMLVDGDKIEKSNLVRQPYQDQDIGENKARILSRKINTFYKMNALYFDYYLLGLELNDICLKYPFHLPIFLGCVDNDTTRRIIETNFKMQKNAIYIDGANTVEAGNVYMASKFGNEFYGKLRSEVYDLTQDTNPGELSCEALVSKGNTQILVTNEKIALAMLEHVYTFLTGHINPGVTIVERFKILHY